MHYEKYLYIYNDDPPQYVCYYVSVPRDLDKHTTITIDNETFDIEADDLEVISELGKTIFRLFNFFPGYGQSFNRTVPGTLPVLWWWW